MNRLLVILCSVVATCTSMITFADQSIETKVYSQQILTLPEFIKQAQNLQETRINATGFNERPVRVRAYIEPNLAECTDRSKCLNNFPDQNKKQKISATFNNILSLNSKPKKEGSGDRFIAYFNEVGKTKAWLAPYFNQDWDDLNVSSNTLEFSVDLGSSRLIKVKYDPKSETEMYFNDQLGIWVKIGTAVIDEITSGVADNMEMYVDPDTLKLVLTLDQNFDAQIKTELTKGLMKVDQQFLLNLQRSQFNSQQLAVLQEKIRAHQVAVKNQRTQQGSKPDFDENFPYLLTLKPHIVAVDNIKSADNILGFMRHLSWQLIDITDDVSFQNQQVNDASVIQEAHSKYTPTSSMTIADFIAQKPYQGRFILDAYLIGTQSCSCPPDAMCAMCIAPTPGIILASEPDTALSQSGNSLIMLLAADNWRLPDTAVIKAAEASNVLKLNKKYQVVIEVESQLIPQNMGQSNIHTTFKAVDLIESL